MRSLTPLALLFLCSCGGGDSSRSWFRYPGDKFDKGVESKTVADAATVHSQPPATFPEFVPVPKQSAVQKPLPGEIKKFDPKAFVSPKPAEGTGSFQALRAWVRIEHLNNLEGKNNDLATGYYNSQPDLPYIRTTCRDMFKTPVFGENTMDLLKDWLCLTYDLKADQVDKMTLTELTARIRYYKESH